MKSSTGFRVNPRAKEIVSFPMTVRKTGLRTECCAVCAERVDGTPTTLRVRKQRTGAAIVGLLLYAIAVALLSYAPDWLWYHSDRLPAVQWGFLVEVLGHWMLWLPALTLFVGFIAARFTGHIRVDAPTCHACEAEVQTTNRNRKILNFVASGLSLILGAVTTFFVQLPLGMTLVIAAPVFIGLRAAVSAFWPSVLTWHGKRGRRILIGVAPRLARYLTSTGRAAEARAPRARLMVGPIAVLGTGLSIFAVAGDHPVCPIDTAPVTIEQTQMDHDVVQIQTCLDRDGAVHGRFVARSRFKHLPVVVGGAEHGMPSGLWWRNGEVVDALKMRLDTGDPFTNLEF